MTKPMTKEEFLDGLHVMCACERGISWAKLCLKKTSLQKLWNQLSLNAKNNKNSKKGDVYYDWLHIYLTNKAACFDKNCCNMKTLTYLQMVKAFRYKVRRKSR